MKTLYIIGFSSFFCAMGFGQNQVDTYMNEARDYLAKEDYRQAQLSLQDAINELNTLIAAQVAESLPDQIDGLTSDNEEITGGGALGIVGGGLQIVKHYQNPQKPENDADVNIMANSPMMSMMNMYMGNPGMMGPGYKSVRVGTHRAVLKTEMVEYYDDQGNSRQTRATEIQLPLTQTLITLNLRGFASEQDELAFTQKLEIDHIREMLGE